jgi:hypothetical protein
MSQRVQLTIGRRAGKIELPRRLHFQGAESREELFVTIPRRLGVVAGLLALVLAVGGCGSGDTGVPPPPPPSELEASLKVALSLSGEKGTLNEFATSQLGDKWKPLVFVPYSSATHEGEDADFKCSFLPKNALYCSTDGKIGYDIDWLSELVKKHGPAAAAFILLHEEGHKFDYDSGHVGQLSIEEENQADCMAGVESQYARVNGLLQPTAFISGFITFMDIAQEDGSWWMEGDHGSPHQRFDAFMKGYGGTVEDCRKIGETVEGVTVDLGAYTLYLPAKTGVEKLQNGPLRASVPGYFGTADLTSYSTEQLGDGSITDKLTKVAYFGQGGASNINEFDTISVPGANGEVKIPIRNLLRDPVSQIAGVTYEQVYDGKPIQGMLVLIWRPTGGVVIDTYAPQGSTPGPDQLSYVRLCMTLITGVL